MSKSWKDLRAAPPRDDYRLRREILGQLRARTARVQAQRLREMNLRRVAGIIMTDNDTQRADRAGGFLADYPSDQLAVSPGPGVATTTVNPHYGELPEPVVPDARPRAHFGERLRAEG